MSYSIEKEIENLPKRDKVILHIPPELNTCVERLYRITGFISVLCPDSDERPLSFARYYHMRRVAWTANLIAQVRHEAGDLIDRDAVQWLAWSHDLNRWPFAHNVEKGLFDQAEDIPRYFWENGIDLQPRLLADVQGIISKSHSVLSKEARIVLLADIVTGFIEDPLWAVVALDLSPDFVPRSISTYLCIGLDRPNVRQRLLNLNYLFEKTRTVEPFKTQFDTIFKEITSEYVLARKLTEHFPLGELEFEQWRKRIKEGFMRKKLFAYNNEKISHGSRLRNEIIEPLYKKLGSSAVSILTKIDEPQTLEYAEKLGILQKHNISRYIPTLDYVTRYEPEKSFRLNSRASQPP